MSVWNVVATGRGLGSLSVMSLAKIAPEELANGVVYAPPLGC